MYKEQTQRERAVWQGAVGGARHAHTHTRHGEGAPAHPPAARGTHASQHPLAPAPNLQYRLDLGKRCFPALSRQLWRPNPMPPTQNAPHTQRNATQHADGDASYHTASQERPHAHCPSRQWRATPSTAGAAGSSSGGTEEGPGRDEGKERRG
ncbi:hypothetical protein BD413DRAFT_47878 [Trametes elegans]|nr:hypothetical protein BD413DRAFT_47878 [Trametes elegans]